MAQDLTRGVAISYLCSVRCEGATAALFSSSLPPPNASLPASLSFFINPINNLKNLILMINYKVSKCKNPKGADGVDYFSCKAAKTSDYTFKELASDIAYSTTCTKADALAVLSSIKPFVQKALLDGRRVVLEDLGSFVIGIRSKCFPTEALTDKEFVPGTMIRGYHIHFRPEVELKKDIAKGIGYKRISSEAMA